MKQTRILSAAVAITVTFLLAVTQSGNRPAASTAAERMERAPVAAPQRPNVLVIITDDQRHDTVRRYMPATWQRIFQAGVTFANAYATTPLCCPSRSSILTGLYAYRHGVKANRQALERQTFVQRLHESGYRTALVGKYLNSWDGTARPEFDYWVSHPGGGSPYFRPRLNVNGRWGVYDGYTTDVLRDHALRFLRETAAAREPFLLLFAPNAPHAPAQPSPTDRRLYPDLQAHRPPSFNEPDVSDKPEWLRQTKPLSASVLHSIDRFRRLQLQSLKSADRAVGDILDTLARQDRLNRTVVIFMSDNGLFWGEHRLVGKGLAYEPAVRIPMAIRYPPALPSGRVETALVANIDVAPTIYELTKVAAPYPLDGLPLTGLWDQRSLWRRDLLLEGWPQPYAPNWAAVHTGRFVYIENQGDRDELYDLHLDPDQLHNQAETEAAAGLLAALRARLAELRGR